MQNSAFRWDDMRFLLALVREGTLTDAATRLGVNASTVSRRIDALEDSLDVVLFDRGPDGVSATVAAEQLMPIAEQFEHAAADVHRTVEGFESEPEGTVRITAPPGIASFFLGPGIARLYERYPRLRVQIDSSISYANLTRRDADIALRTTRPHAGDLVAKQLGGSRTAVLASRAYASEVGLVRDADDLRWLTWAADLAHLPDARWLAANVAERQIALRSSSIEVQVGAARSGLGAMLLPKVWTGLTELTPVRLSRKLAASVAGIPTQSLWLVGHRALRRVPRISVVWEFIEREVQERLGGRAT